MLSHYSDAIDFSDLFVSNALVYSSPELGVFNFGALIEFNDADAQGDAVDERFEVAGTFRHQALAVHAGYVKSPVHDGLFGLAASYSTARLSWPAFTNSGSMRINFTV